MKAAIAAIDLAVTTLDLQAAGCGVADGSGAECLPRLRIGDDIAIQQCQGLSRSASEHFCAALSGGRLEFTNGHGASQLTLLGLGALLGSIADGAYVTALWQKNQ